MIEQKKLVNINYQKEIDNIAEWMKEYLEESDCKGYVIGISGGIDSAIIASLCCKAVGKGNVIATYLPCQSSLNMVTDAIQLAKNLGIELRIFYLIDSYDAIIKELETGGESVSNLTQANIKARLRMTYLFAIANQYNYLVAGTGNKSELDIGYVTVGGDQIVSIEPLGNFYKTEIYKIAKLIPEIPANILTKPASADLYESQTDEQEIGFTYKKLDIILEALEQGNMKQLDTYLIEDIEKIQNMIKKAKYKNKVPPRYIRK